MAKVTDEQLREAVDALAEHGTKAGASRALGVPVTTLRGRLRMAEDKGLVTDKPQGDAKGERFKYSEHGDVAELESVAHDVRTLEDAISKADVDMTVWEVERFVANSWEVVGGEVGRQPLWQVKVWFKKKEPRVRAVHELIEQLKAESPVVAKIKRAKKKKGSPRRALEVSIVDPHFGLQCYNGDGKTVWSLDKCYDAYLYSNQRLLELAEPYGPFEEIVVPIGNDFLHVDGVFSTTTAGTLQPEAVSYHEMFRRGCFMLIQQIEQLKQIAPVKVKPIPGNHDRQSVFAIGMVLWAKFFNDANVDVDIASDSYKFWSFGVNLIGFEHGHSVKGGRFPGLMANETRTTHWRDARYCEWHCSDQHRKGTAKPSTFEEQGVSVEYLPGLTPPNEWSKLKAYNWQKRGAMAFAYDYEAGPQARLQVNFDNYADDFMGRN